MHWEWVYLPASSYAIFSSCFLSTNQPHSACLNTGGLRISKKMQFRGLRTTRSWITSWHSKTWIRAKYSSWHISIQESQENFVPNTGTKPLRQIFLAVRSHPAIKQLNVRNIKTRWNPTTVQEVSSTRDISLHFCIALFADMQRDYHLHFSNCIFISFHICLHIWLHVHHYTPILALT